MAAGTNTALAILGLVAVVAAMTFGLSAVMLWMTEPSGIARRGSGRETPGSVDSREIAPHGEAQ